MNYKQLLPVVVFMVLPLLANGNVLVQQNGQLLADPLQRMAAELLAVLNWERELNDLPALTSEALLCQAAAVHNEKMIKEQRLDHEFPHFPSLPERLKAQGLLLVEFCGENIARSDSDSIEQVHETLMASPLHRANILNKSFTHCGIAVKKAGGTYYFTQEFAGLPVLKETQRAERLIVSDVMRLLRDAGKREIIELSGELWKLRKAAYQMLKGTPGSLAPETVGCVYASFFGFDLPALARRFAKEMRIKGYMAFEVGIALSKKGKGSGILYYYVQARMCPGQSEADKPGMNRN